MWQGICDIETGKIPHTWASCLVRRIINLFSQLEAFDSISRVSL